MSGLDDLPHEVILRIFLFLDPLESYPIISLVCKNWYLLSNDEHLWKMYYNNQIAGALHTHAPGSTKNIYLSSYRWVINCMKDFSVSQQILFAAMFGHSCLYKKLLYQNAIDPELFLSASYCTQNHSRNIIQAATAQGYSEIVEITLNYITKKPSIDSKCINKLCCSNDELGYNVIHIASMKGQIKILKEILKWIDILPKNIIDKLTLIKNIEYVWIIFFSSL